jgi:D-alanyl-D-alanine carboxypeptidase
VVVLVALCVMLSAVSDADAAKRRSKKRYAKPNPAVTGVNDPRYAALILNPATGEVYHERNADARRYPASLTKMMTLYLLFEALENGKTTLDARMDISELAARQPQTNLSLDAGDSIPVETAIKALVVRSANDVSVVVAEALGGSVEGFAQIMTAKAKSLGMRNTVFKNPNGLPNAAQVTTARDMAKLGIALKRDFPNYYHYFSTLQFSYEGVTYYTHNRVLMRYAGADGIKTGYINSSGFNLVTSVERGGRPLVGVVLGGGSGGWRDTRMIQLLDGAPDDRY